MKRRLYVELDSLLDTRLATLILMDEAEAAKALETTYRTRVSDDWSMLGLAVDQVEYEERYRNRDRRTLQAARPTGIVPMVHNLIGALNKMADNTPFVEAVTLDVNFWPYRVKDAERLEILAAITYSIGGAVVVDSVYFAPHELTPHVIDQCWDGVIMYDFNRWLTDNEAALKEKRMPTVAFIAPTLYAQHEPTKAETYVEEMGEVSPFAALEAVLVEYLMLHMTDTEYFSFVKV